MNQKEAVDAVVFMKIQNNRDSVCRVTIKFDWQLARYEPSSPSTR